ncbi:MAG: TadG family pilus assembly protein, partial [Planctomycetota bacterium]
MKWLRIRGPANNEHGAVAIMVGLCLFVLVGFSAFAIDIPNLCVAKNELQNAADAGALAGAQNLYNNAGTAVNVNANQIARDVGVANGSQGTPAEVNWTGGNTGDVQRGHWSFTTKTFTPNASLAPVDLWNRSTAELDLDLNFINAIRVVTRRQNIPVQSSFARIFGINSFPRAAEAIAYIGFAGTLRPEDGEQPIAICAESLRNESGQYTCNVGRMINSGQNLAT